MNVPYVGASLCSCSRLCFLAVSTEDARLSLLASTYGIKTHQGFLHFKSFLCPLISW